MSVLTLTTWVSISCFKVVSTADAGGVQRVNAEGGELASKLLDIAVFTVQRHLKLQTHLVLFRYQLNTTHEQVVNCSSTKTKFANINNPVIQCGLGNL